MPTTLGFDVGISPDTDGWAERDRATRLRHHFTEVSSRYRRLRDLDLNAVRVISGVLARTEDHGRPVRLLDVGTGAGRYLDAVSEALSAALPSGVFPVGLDRTSAMLTQARRRNGHARVRAQHLVSTVEMLPFRASSCDVMMSFNAVHHFDLPRFMREASRVLTPSGQLVLYTRTRAQNRRTIWGRYFPEFAARETRLPRVADLRAALAATGAFASVRAQTLTWRVTTSLSRLVEQAAHYHYSTFRMYADDALHAAIDTFRQRVRRAFPDATRITHDNDHVLVMAQRTAAREPREAPAAPRVPRIRAG